MSNETELQVAAALQHRLLMIIDKDIGNDFVILTSDQIASILISTLGIIAAQSIVKHIPCINRESYVKLMDLIHDCAISMWDLNEDKE